MMKLKYVVLSVALLSMFVVTLYLGVVHHERAGALRNAVLYFDASSQEQRQLAASLSGYGGRQPSL